MSFRRSRGLPLSPPSKERRRAGERAGLAACWLLALALLVQGCAPSLSACAPGDLRAGLITDASGIDGVENALAWQGLERADEELAVCAQFIESRTEQDYRRNVTALAEEGFGLVVAGPALAPVIQEMAEKYPGTHFLLVDGAIEPPPANVHGLTFRVDQAAFPAGYLAAAWATLEDPAGPWVGYVASRLNPSAEQYVAGFKAGVAYYNAQRRADVGLRGVYLDADETQDADLQANALIDLGIEVILEVSDGEMIGALTMAKGRGRWGIGSDRDRYQDSGEARDILLTSAVKRTDNAVYSFLEAWVEGADGDLAVVQGTLENGGVGLAPYHDTEKQIPSSIQAELAGVLEAIAKGNLDTGWEAP